MSGLPNNESALLVRVGTEYIDVPLLIIGIYVKRPFACVYCVA